MRRSTGPKESACNGKVWYKSPKKAKEAASRANRRPEVEPERGKIRAYKCSYCGWHHIGHTNGA
jgi:hypothetical protein